MPLKFRKFIPGKPAHYHPSELQKSQWNQFAAIGYSMAIRGYLLCWRTILIRAGITDACIIYSIDNLLEISRLAEKRARWNIRHLRSLKP